MEILKPYALELLHGPLMELGEKADALRRKKHQDKAFYTVNAAITYSNTCEALCPICSFARREGEAGAYILRPEEIYGRAKKFAAAGAREVHIIGGMYAKLGLDYYVGILRAIKRASADLNIVAFTVSECVLMSRVSGKSLGEIFEILVAEGVNALPGGGAEVFDEGIRKKISPNKLTESEWLGAMRLAHETGLRTNATMLYGHIEKPGHVVDHLFKLRDLQAQTGGFKAFVPLPFRRGKSEISASTSGTYDLKICALSRLILDNFGHVRVPVTHFGDRMAQVLLNFGADDIGGTHWNEEVAVSAGAVVADRTQKALEDLIKSAGFMPCFTDSNYA